jgi:hypothetical protein
MLEAIQVPRPRWPADSRLGSARDKEEDQDFPNGEDDFFLKPLRAKKATE